MKTKVHSDKNTSEKSLPNSLSGDEILRNIDCVKENIIIPFSFLGIKHNSKIGLLLQDTLILIAQKYKEEEHNEYYLTGRALWETFGYQNTSIHYLHREFERFQKVVVPDSFLSYRDDTPLKFVGGRTFLITKFTGEELTKKRELFDRVIFLYEIHPDLDKLIKNAAIGDGPEVRIATLLKLGTLSNMLLYKLIKDHIATGKERMNTSLVICIALEEIRIALGVKNGMYSEYNNLKVRKLAPAIDAIHKYTEIDIIDFSPERKGKEKPRQKVTHIRFTVRENYQKISPPAEDHSQLFQQVLQLLPEHLRKLTKVTSLIKKYEEKGSEYLRSNIEYFKNECNEIKKPLQKQNIHSVLRYLTRAFTEDFANLNREMRSHLDASAVSKTAPKSPLPGSSHLETLRKKLSEYSESCPDTYKKAEKKLIVETLSRLTEKEKGSASQKNLVWKYCKDEKFCEELLKRLKKTERGQHVDT